MQMTLISQLNEKGILLKKFGGNLEDIQWYSLRIEDQ
jgi:hypothetical protein